MKEKELKYSIKNEHDANLVKSFFESTKYFSNYRLDESGIFLIRDVYYDSDSLQLNKSSGYLRLRNKNGERFITLKKGFSENPDEIIEFSHVLTDKGIEFIVNNLIKHFNVDKIPDFSAPSFSDVLLSIGLKPTVELQMKRIQKNVYLQNEDITDEICRIRFDEFTYQNKNNNYYELEVINFRRVFDNEVDKFIKEFQKALDVRLTKSIKNKYSLGLM